MLLPRCERIPRSDSEKEGIPADQPRLGWRILLVEDDDALAELIGQMLEELGCEVSREATADDALRGFNRGGVDLVLSDMVMPGNRNGLDLARELRREWPDLPLVLMTGYSSAASSAAEEGFRVLAKPFTLDALAARLAEVMPAGPQEV